MGADQGRKEHRPGLRLLELSASAGGFGAGGGELRLQSFGIGADKLLSEKARAIFNEAYPGKSIDIMWWRPVEPTWFAELRGQYAEKFKAA